MKVVQFGLCHSPNVGDGVIAECLGWALAQRGVRDFTAVDMSGRRAAGARTVPHRALAMRVLAALPRRPRRRLVAGLLGRALAREAPRWRRAVEGADLVVLGGGQLFSDADLNFCLKIAAVARVVHDAGVPLAIHAVGVSRNWSDEGRALFAEVAATDLRMVGVRDAESAQAWQDQLPGAIAPELTPDPGLLAAACYGPPAVRDGRVGVCVTAPQVLAYHSDGGVGRHRADLFAEIAVALAARGKRVRLFCNGAEEDRAALERLARHREVRRLVGAGSVEVTAAPETPAALASVVGSCSGVVAHRLHACIVGHSYGLPVVGLGWDRKVQSFLASIGAPERFFPAEAADAVRIADAAAAMTVAGRDDRRGGDLAAQAQAGIDRLLAAAVRPVARAVSA